MCGIFCSISCHGFIAPHPATKQLLHNRGPDSSGQYQVVINTEARDDNGESPSAPFHATFYSTVLSLRGQSIVDQPLRDAQTGSVLCWNGEAWSVGDDIVAGNDSKVVFDGLLSSSSSSQSAEESIRAVIALLASVRGPYAFVFFDATRKLVYYGRDCLGRRSLLRKTTADGALILSSVCDNASGESWMEVEADGVYVTDLGNKSSNQQPLLLPRHILHCLEAQAKPHDLSFVGELPSLHSLLTSIDPTLPSFEPQPQRQCVPQ